MKITKEIIFPGPNILLILLFFTGCSGNIIKTNNINNIENTQLSSIDVGVTAKVKDELDTDAVFNAEMLKNNIETQLLRANLKEINSPYKLTILINDVRYRSTFSAVMFGFLAGNDHIYGKARVNDQGGNLVNEFEVNTSYAFGGLAGGVAVIKDQTRMGWLYDRFAELIIEGVKGDIQE